MSKGNCAITLPNDTISSDKLLPLLRQGWYEAEKQGFKEALGSCTLKVYTARAASPGNFSTAVKTVLLMLCSP